jgi:two-component system, cell cycle sensor histidine kinase and response regulator CckA
VVQSGGYIWVDSEAGKGTAFKICFPRVDPEAESVPPPARSRERTEGSETILLVEDEQAVRTVATRVLRNQGYFVLPACNGEEALSIADQVNGAIDLVLTDVIMPDMAGPAMVRQILEKWSGIRIVYMSGYAQNDKIRSEMADRDTSFLQKPFSADSLLLTVREVLDQAIRKGI